MTIWPFLRHVLGAALLFAGLFLAISLWSSSLSARPVSAVVNIPSSSAGALVDAARKQVGVTVSYDPAYVPLKFPNGDVPIQTGVCADVVIRALRQQGIDLQILINKDMRANFAKYPHIWGLKSPDSNIDHRRVLNMMMYFSRKGYAVSGANQAGDIVAWRLINGMTHIGIVSDTKALLGDSYKVIHNIGRGTQEEMFVYPATVIGHYRIAM